MLYAIVDNSKRLAAPALSGSCPFCKSHMTPKCGKIIMWHWAHTRMSVCDEWFQPETEWHRNWKSIFGKENSEVIMVRDNEKHIADIVTKRGFVIELQNSNISYDTIEIREKFYGDMIWIINASHFENNFIRIPLPPQLYDAPSPEFEYYAKLNGFKPKYKPPVSEPQEFRYKWLRVRESWLASRCPVYLDFGGLTLLHITEGLGTNQGKGYEISKLEFIKNHEGDETSIDKVIQFKSNA